ncbi:MAG: hypothetical protein JRE16_11175 [Deltaproteobacteria bacterium]|nr:hypothetical protein [Deltaproteobacteria bacterium]MBW2476074.1 hypothetical protein [Deltaproteobacteria bacterium]MBW2505115.1 hypothetical protein [Deltaproteobacteria bacterium]MBW2519724.1 hypothetical protein [Deltaproteobacteria bacterium]
MLNAEILYTLKEAKPKIEQQLKHYNTGRAHRLLGYRRSSSET